MKSRRHIAAALIFGISATHAIAGTTAPGYEPAPAVTPHDEVFIRPALNNAPAAPFVLAAEATPRPESTHAAYHLATDSSSRSLRIATVWAIIFAGLGGIVLLLWRNHQEEKTQSRWRKRHSKWRIF
jgi:hypothetical protein